MSFDIHVDTLSHYTTCRLQIVHCLFQSFMVSICSGKIQLQDEYSEEGGGGGVGKYFNNIYGSPPELTLYLITEPTRFTDLQRKPYGAFIFMFVYGAIYVQCILQICILHYRCIFTCKSTYICLPVYMCRYHT